MATQIHGIGRGHVTAEWIRPDGGIDRLAEADNSWMYSWAHIMTMLASGESSYAPAYLYVEFMNVAAPSDAVPIPTISRTDTVAYYTGLSGSASADYLRLPVMTRSPGRDASYSDTQYLPAGMYNQLTFLAQTADGTGIGGKTFNNTVNSKIYGVALAAGPVPADPTQDVLWGRLYYTTAGQFLVPSPGNVQLTYRITGY